MHSYLKPIALAFAIHGLAAVAALPACPEEYDSSARYGYSEGDQVSVTPAGDRTGKIYQCQSWPNSGHCVKDVYSPVNTEKVCGGDVCWPLAWTFEGDCEPTDSAALEACPEEFEEGTGYEAGDQVSVTLAGETYGKSISAKAGQMVDIALKKHTLLGTLRNFATETSAGHLPGPMKAVATVPSPTILPNLLYFKYFLCGRR